MTKRTICRALFGSILAAGTGAGCEEAPEPQPAAEQTAVVEEGNYAAPPCMTSAKAPGTIQPRTVMCTVEHIALGSEDESYLVKPHFIDPEDGDVVKYSCEAFCKMVLNVYWGDQGLDWCVPSGDYSSGCETLQPHEDEIMMESEVFVIPRAEKDDFDCADHFGTPNDFCLAQGMVESVEHNAGFCCIPDEGGGGPPPGGPPGPEPGTIAISADAFAADDAPKPAD
jgi:hypothetical protein